MPTPRLPAQVVGIGLAQVIAWGSSTYLPAALAQPMAASLGINSSLIFALVSLSLAWMALLGPAIGRAIDRQGGRRVLAASNLTLALALIVLATAQGPFQLLAGWLLLGSGMASGLYDAAFAALVREHGTAARRPITGITLLGGFASTLAWPFSAWLLAHWDWRIACLCWAGLHLGLALPLNLVCLRRQTPLPPESPAAQPVPAKIAVDRRRQVILLGVFGAATAFVTAAIAAHLPRLLIACGLAPAAAIAAAALFGPAQVAARLGEYLIQGRGRSDPLSSARLATSLHPLGAAVLLAFGSAGPFAAVFVILHGAGNGLITIAKGVLPLHLFGAAGYGELQGRLAIAQRILQAAAPLSLALVLEHGGATAALTLTASISLLAWLALLGLRRA